MFKKIKEVNMKKNNAFCQNCFNGICPYKREFLGFHKNIRCGDHCVLKDKKDYQSFTSNHWYPSKIKLFYHSTCPMVSLNWWKNKEEN